MSRLLTTAPPGVRLWIIGAVVAFALAPSVATAQVTPAQGYTPPDDTPSVKVGGTIFTNYTYSNAPTTKDAGGSVIRANSFDVTRAYLNVTGNLSHLLSYRITPDVTRLVTTAKGLASNQSVSTSVDGSEAFRLKYAFGQLSLDQWLPKGSWIRFGLQQTPFVDFMEGVYRYRFQNPIFVDAEKFLTSSDFGASGHLNFPGNYGDFHLGVYNGDGYSKAEVNDRKAVQARGTVRPLPMDRFFRGLRLTAFYDADEYLSDFPRNRFVGSLTFEHKYFNGGFDYLSAQDQTSKSTAKVDAAGYSIWAVPRSTVGLEGLLRYDSLKPNKSVDARKNRGVLGVAYWFKTQAPVTAAILADYEQVKYDKALNSPYEQRYALHCLFNF